jgi:Xaa-Pro aminopeptidase
MTNSAVHRRSATPPNLDARVRALQERLADWKTPALLVTNPRDIRYLTGFVGDDSWAVVWAHGGPVSVISDFRFQEQIQREAPHVVVHLRKKGLADELAKMLGKRRIRGLALQAEYVTLAQRKTLGKKVPRVSFKAVDDGLLKQRAVKDPGEVAAIRRALKIQQEAYRRTLAQLKPGQSEEQIAAFLEYQMRLLGADGRSFPTIVAADANASLPHAIPGKAKVRSGGIVLIDFGARWGGYCGDLTRTIALGRMPAKVREIYRITLEAQLAAIAAIAPGKTLKEIDAVARNIIKKAGYSKRFGHGLGHGIGLDIHEQPVLSFRADGVLEPGQVVTVEPGIYLPGVGGVRIEDDVLVTPHGREVLSDLPKDLESAII